MKKIILAILVASPLAACGHGSSATTNTTVTNTSTPSGDVQETTTTERQVTNAQ